jgi:hypothetical protein
VKSPTLFTERFAQAGMNAVMVPMHVLPDRFDAAMTSLMGLGNRRWARRDGAVQGARAAFATRLGKTASAIGAVNALRRERDGSWTGDMFDGVGIRARRRAQGSCVDRPQGGDVRRRRRRQRHRLRAAVGRRGVARDRRSGARSRQRARRAAGPRVPGSFDRGGGCRAFGRRHDRQCFDDRDEGR